ncbi:MAG: hypothetical protein J6A61_07980 [Clostridia bacterium]|nr:hypothetical protein [Clostridia bacterium]
MSYKFTCYFQDETIATTTMYVSYIGQTYIGSYGDDYKSISGLGDNWSTRFTANPAEGCEFVRWVYRIGSTSAAVQYSYDNPFTYSGGADIYIRAEGTYSGGEEPDPEPTWGVTSSTIGQISTNYTKKISVSNYTIYRYKVSFERSGKANFYTQGTIIDTLGYLSTSSTFDSETGEPTNWLKKDDDSNGAPNFFISYNVTAGTQYYIWVRCYFGDNSGSTTLYIDPPPSPWTLTTGFLGTLGTEENHVSFILGEKQMQRYSVSFENSGTANFFTMGDYDTWGYLSTSSTFDSETGEPTNWLVEDGYSGPGDNFAISYNVTAGTTYYIWICEAGGAATGAIDLYIQPPAKAVDVEKWSWTKSNNNATASQTQKAYTAITNKGYVTDFSYIVWNDLVDKVKEILDATGDSWDASYTTFAAAKMTSSDKTLTAAKFNSLRYNIGSHYSTGITEKTPGDYVYGWYITTLAECINGWIDSL